MIFIPIRERIYSNNMNISYITSTSNATVKNVNALRQKKNRDEDGVFVIEGIKLLYEAFSAGVKIKSVFAEEKVFKANEAFISSVNADAVYVVNEAVSQKLSEWKTPQGLVAVTEKPQFDIDTILLKDEAFILVLDGVGDPGNIGTMVRTAEAAGVDAIITAEGTADCFGAKALRASMGSIFRIPVFENFKKCDIIYTMRSKGFAIAATSLDGDNVLEAAASHKKIAAVFGNEGSGISDEFIEGADMLLRLPMAGRVESLNVAVSAGIIMYMLNKNKILKDNNVNT